MLLRGSHKLAQRLPHEITGVIGILRNGAIPASVIASERGLSLAFIRPRTRVVRLQDLCWSPTLPPPGTILVIDDGANTSATMRWVTKHLHCSRGYRLFRAVMFTSNRRRYRTSFDLCLTEVARPRIFEWEMWSFARLNRMAFDLDGVLAKDVTRRIDEDQRPAAYRRALLDAPCLHRPKRPVRLIATGRLEKWRHETKDWLRRHGIRYHQLVMSGHRTAYDRWAADDVATMKATHFVLSKAFIFVESEPRQARQIANLSGKEVLSWREGVIIQPKV